MCSLEIHQRSFPATLEQFELYVYNLMQLAIQIKYLQGLS